MDKDYDKQGRYAALKKRLSVSLKYGFWFEAIMIEYAIVEDRTASILFHTGVSENAYSEKKRLSNKLNSIEFQIIKKHPIISKKISQELLDDTRKWKDARDKLIHLACNNYCEDEAQKIAEEGNCIVNFIINASRRVSDAAKRENTR